MSRPVKFDTSEKMQEAIDAYFYSCDNAQAGYTKDGEVIIGKPYTISGLARALGMCRQSMYNYEGKEEFLDTIKDARLRCEEFAETQLYIGGSPSGAIFALKNFGWTDKQEVDMTNNSTQKIATHSQSIKQNTTRLDTLDNDAKNESNNVTSNSNSIATSRVQIEKMQKALPR